MSTPGSMSSDMLPDDELHYAYQALYGSSHLAQDWFTACRRLSLCSLFSQAGQHLHRTLPCRHDRGLRQESRNDRHRPWYWTENQMHDAVSGWSWQCFGKVLLLLRSSRLPQVFGRLCRLLGHRSSYLMGLIWASTSRRC